MTLPFTFPDWMPWWLQLIVVVGAILVGLAFLMMPFSVFGVKARLDALEAQLEDIQGQLRSLAARLPEPSRGPYDEPALLRVAAAAPPAPEPVMRSPTLRAAARLGERAEPRLGRPR